MDAIDCRWRQAFDLKLARSELAERLHTLIGSKSIHQQTLVELIKSAGFCLDPAFFFFILYNMH